MVIIKTRVKILFGLRLRGAILNKICYNLINNFSIIACGARRARSCATVYLLMGAQHTLRAGIVRDDRELFHQIIQPAVILHGVILCCTRRSGSLDKSLG